MCAVQGFIWYASFSHPEEGNSKIQKHRKTSYISSAPPVFRIFFLFVSFFWISTCSIALPACYVSVCPPPPSALTLSTRPAAESRWLMKWCLCLWWWRSALPGVCCHSVGLPQNRVLRGQNSDVRLRLTKLFIVLILRAHLYPCGRVCSWMYRVYEKMFLFDAYAYIVFACSCFVCEPFCCSCRILHGQ